MTNISNDKHIEEIAWKLRELSESLSEISSYSIVSNDVLDSITGELISEEDAGSVRSVLNEKNW